MEPVTHPAKEQPLVPNLSADSYKDEANHKPIVDFFEKVFAVENNMYFIKDNNLLKINKPKELMKAVSWVFVTTEDRSLAEKIQNIAFQNLHLVCNHYPGDTKIITWDPKDPLSQKFSILHMAALSPYFAGLSRDYNVKNEYIKGEIPEINVDDKRVFTQADSTSFRALFSLAYFPTEQEKTFWDDKEIKKIASLIDFTLAGEKLDIFLYNSLGKYGTSPRYMFTILKIATLAKMPKTKVLIENHLFKTEVLKYRELLSEQIDEKKERELSEQISLLEETKSTDKKKERELSEQISLLEEIEQIDENKQHELEILRKQLIQIKQTIKNTQDNLVKPREDLIQIEQINIDNQLKLFNQIEQAIKDNKYKLDAERFATVKGNLTG